MKDFKRNDPYVCFLALKELRLGDLDAGSSNPTLNRNHAHRVELRVPEPRVQRRIASVGMAFDELIAINERRIESPGGSRPVAIPRVVCAIPVLWARRR